MYNREDHLLTDCQVNEPLPLDSAFLSVVAGILNRCTGEFVHPWEQLSTAFLIGAMTWLQLLTAFKRPLIFHKHFLFWVFIVFLNLYESLILFRVKDESELLLVRKRQV